MEQALDKYIRTHSTPQGEALEWVEKQTNILTNYPHMLSGPVQGRLLTILTRLCGARMALEIGTFTGYSAICLANGLPEDGHLDALEINDEMEDIIRASLAKAGVADRVSLTIGNALETLKGMSDRTYDLAYIDANKRQYCDYYEIVLPLIRPGGLIIADDVLWNGKLLEKDIPHDKQTQGMSMFNDLVAIDPRVEVVMLPIRDGISLIRKK